MSYGLTDKGFVKKPYEAIVEELEQRYRDIFGNTINLEPQSPQGQLIAITAEAIYDTWEMAENVYSSFNVDHLSGLMLDQRAVLKNETRFENESDVDFRTRIKEQLPNSVIQLKDELRDNLTRLDGVTNLDVKYHRGITEVFAVGGDDLEIANTILDYMPPGDLNGNFSVNTNGRCNGVKFFRPVFVPVHITIALSYFAHLECECEAIDIEKIRDAIIDNACGLGYGEYLYKEYIRNIVSKFKGLKIEDISLREATIKTQKLECNEEWKFEKDLDFVEIREYEKVLLCRENIIILEKNLDGEFVQESMGYLYSSAPIHSCAIQISTSELLE